MICHSNRDLGDEHVERIIFTNASTDRKFPIDPTYGNTSAHQYRCCSDLFDEAFVYPHGDGDEREEEAP